MDSRTRNDEKKTAGGLFWMLVPLFLLVTSSSGWLLMVSVAVDDPGFAVERDYYKKAAAYDEIIEQRRENTRLGWTVEAVGFSHAPSGGALLTLVVKNGQGKRQPNVRVSAAVFHNARANDVQELEASSSGDGSYLLELVGARDGLWEARIRVEGEGVLTKTLRVELSSRPRVVNGRLPA